MNSLRRIFTGPNVRLHRSPVGDIASFRPPGQEFVGAWYVHLVSPNLAIIEPGTINKVDPTIKGVNLSDDPPPMLEFPKISLDSVGRGYICAEITCDPTKQWAITKIEMVQVANPDSDNPRAKGINAIGGAQPLPGHRARFPIAMLRQRATGSFDAIQMAWFDVQHSVQLLPDNQTPQRHFFF